MNCFFAAIEQLDNPKWRQQPVAVTNGLLGTTIITCSYEARAYGIKTGMKLSQARLLCPQLIQAPTRPERYARLSTNILEGLTQLTPDIEVYSVDEAFLDFTHCQHLYAYSPTQIGRRIKQLIKSISGGLNCSVGISGDKTTAKFAAKKHKPDGLVIIHPKHAEEALAEYPVTALSGINKGVAGFLAQYGVIYCKQMKKLPISVLAQRYGNLGRRIWLMAQGQDPEPLIKHTALPKSLGHGKNLPPETKDKQLILTYFQHMAEKVAARLRQYNFQAKHFFIAFKTKLGWLKQKAQLPLATDDGRSIYHLCKDIFIKLWSGQGVWQIRVVALEPQLEQQIQLFGAFSERQYRQHLNQTIDNVNARYGEFAIAPARLLNRSKMPNVIAPAWKPTGHRKTV